MTIPEFFYQATIEMIGTALPNGAAWTFGGANIATTTAEDVANRVAVAISSSTLMSNFSSSVEISAVLIKLGPDETGPSFYRVTGIPGSLGSAAVPPAVSALVVKSTDAGGRRGRGRFFLPGLLETEVTQAGVIDGARRSAINTDLAALLTLLDTDDLPMVLLHDRSTEWVLVDGQPRRIPTGGAPPAPDIVNQLSVQASAGTQRRRQRR